MKVLNRECVSRSYLEPLLLGVTPHVTVVLGLVVDTVDNDEGKVAVVNLLLERLDETFSKVFLTFGLILILKVRASNAKYPVHPVVNEANSPLRQSQSSHPSRVSGEHHCRVQSLWP